MSLRSGGQIATAQEPILNPHNLKIVGWWCSSNLIPGRTVLLADDVREVMPQGLAVNDESAISAPGDLVRHQDILNIRFELIDKLVKTKSHKLGKVSDFTYDDSMFVQKLYVSRSLVKLFSSEDTLIIDRVQILEITDKYILVDEADAKVGAENSVPAGAAIASS
jgi:hypothetical protein